MRDFILNIQIPILILVIVINTVLFIQDRKRIKAEQMKRKYLLIYRTNTNDECDNCDSGSN
jgi:hypothetical protein